MSKYSSELFVPINKHPPRYRTFQISTVLLVTWLILSAILFCLSYQLFYICFQESILRDSKSTATSDIYVPSRLDHADYVPHADHDVQGVSLNIYDKVRRHLAGEVVIAELEDEVIERFLLSRDHDINGTVQLIRDYLKMRYDHAEFFPTVSESLEKFKPRAIHLVDHRLPDGSPVIYMDIGKFGIDGNIARKMSQLVPFLESYALEGQNNVTTTTIIDMVNWSWRQYFASSADSVMLAQSLVEEVLPIKPGGPIHVVRAPWYVSGAYSVAKTRLTEGQRQQIRMHGDIDQLFQELDRQYIPTAIPGGQAKFKEYSQETIDDMDAKLLKYYKSLPSSSQTRDA
ncbi:hypothetical protein HDE_07780 [Halotydeus destructor]|nr:hypothetical protein HDE_07780 [Halotydeus destructor]